MNRLSFLMIIFILFSCDVDEDPPEFPTGLRSHFTMSEGNPRVNLTWDKSISDDVKEYHIFKKNTKEDEFDSLTVISGSINSYVDNKIEWQEIFAYIVRAIDVSTNVGEFSDTTFVECYKASGTWTVPEYDSVEICIVPEVYSISSSFQLVIADSFVTQDDTIGVFIFSDCILDSNEWTGSGWMTYTYSTLNINSLNGEVDTIQTTGIPEYYLLDMSKPDSGYISFLSGNYNSINFIHTLKSCDGDSLFP